ncbi:MAG: response regulator [bacterium]
MSGNETILVVEDEETVRNVTSRLLHSLGYTVLTAENSHEAINLFETQGERIDLVIMDIILPELSGPKVYERMRAIRPNLSILFVSGYDLHTGFKQLAHLGQKHVRMLQKPFTKESLAKTVRKLLDQ